MWIEWPQRNNAIIISKATDHNKESYSGFDETELNQELKIGEIFNVFLGGLAIDYCVKNTVLDALKLGFKTFFLEDASHGIELRPGDVARSIETMRKNGVRFVKKSTFT